MSKNNSCTAKTAEKYKESWEKMAQVRSTIILIFEKHYYKNYFLKKIIT